MEARVAMRPTFCVFSKHLNWLTISELAEALVQIGFDGVDLAVRPGGHVDPENVSEELPAAIELLDRKGLACPMIVTGITEPDETAREVVRVAAECGVGVYRMGYFRYGDSIAEDRREFKRHLDGLTELNGRYGITGAYQNHCGDNLFGAPVWDLAELLVDLSPDAMGCQYDVRHAVIEGGLSWPLGMRAVAPWIRSIVIKDALWHRNPDGSFSPKSVSVGFGMVDWGRYCELLPETGWNGTVSVHFEHSLLSRPADELSRDEITKETIAEMSAELERVKTLLEPSAR